MRIDKVREILRATPEVTAWFLYHSEAETNTVIHLPKLYVLDGKRVVAIANSEPREVLLSPSENMFLHLFSAGRTDGEEWMGEGFGQLVSDDASAVRDVLSSLLAGSRSQRNRPFPPLPEPTQTYPDVPLADSELMAATRSGLVSRVRAFTEGVLSRAEQADRVEVSNLELFVRRIRFTLETSSGLSLHADSTRLTSEICFLADLEGGRRGEHTARLSARRFPDLEVESLGQRGADYARSIAAAGSPPAYTGPVVLELDAAADAMLLAADGLGGSPLAFHADARSVFEGTSRYQKGEPLSGDKAIRGDLLNLASDPLLPYGVESGTFSHDDASPARRVSLVTGGAFDGLLGSRKYFHYLDLLGRETEPPGPVGNTVVSPGSLLSSELTAGGEAVVLVKSFSGWNTDSASGDFSCEIRLGELRRGGVIKPFTGGMLVGNYFNALADARFSRETIRIGGYYGPQAIRFGELTVSG